MNIFRIFPVVSLLTLVAGAVLAGNPAAIAVSQPWVRALPPTMNRTAAYMTLINRGDATAEVVGGRAELAQTVEIHTTRDVDGYRRMEQLDSISIAPDQRVRLQPGGTHLMLLGLSRMPAAGETLPLCVGLASGAEVCTVAQVRTAAGRQSEPGHHHQHQK